MIYQLQAVLFVIILATASTLPLNAGSSDLESAVLIHTPLNLIAHNITRLRQDQNDLIEVRLVNYKLFGFDSDNALLTANFEAIARHARNVPQVYALILRTSDGGITWTQNLDSVERRISYITDVKFIGKRGLMLYEHSLAGNRFGFLYSQDQGENWIDAELEGVAGSFHLVEWSVRRPQSGIAVIYSDSGIPIDGDPEHETAYWIVETLNGFRWKIVKTIQRGQEAGFVPGAATWPSEWDSFDDSWNLVDDGEWISVDHSKDGVEAREVLTLPSGVIWTVHGTSED